MGRGACSAGSDLARRRLLRNAAQQRFKALAADYLRLANVGRSRMFGSEGLMVNAKFFAFVGRDGQLIIKVPAARAAALLADGEATHVRAGRSVMREWIGLPMPADQSSAERWSELMADAYRYVASLTSSSSRDR